MTDTIHRPRRRWLTIALVLIVFASGIVVGAGSATIVIVRRAQHAIQHPELQSERVAERLKRRLDLRADQFAEVRSILARRQVALMQIRAETMPRVKLELLAVRDEVGGLLDARQRARWDELFDEFSGRWMPPAAPTTNRAP